MTAQSPARQVAAFINKFDPKVARLAKATRAALRKRFFPTAVELVYDNYNALAMGFGPNERTSEAIISVAAFARGVTLYFIHGATLADPRGLLQGQGNQGRFIRMETLATLDKPGVAALIRAAIKESDSPLPKTGRGYTVIKSISAKQRPRRPRLGADR
jgi:hypothetical protein